MTAPSSDQPPPRQEQQYPGRTAEMDPRPRDTSSISGLRGNKTLIDHIGITDAANVVLADRYRTTRLLTLGQRHFRRLRPLWGADHFTLLPYDS
jgi:hypothetical protein